MQALLCAVLLLGVALLSNSCRRDLEILRPPSLTVNPAILKAKNYVDSVVKQQGPNAFIKKMSFDILWEKAITDSANNIRVPISFNFSQRKSKNGKQTKKAITKDVFELFVKNSSGKLEADIIHFMSFKGNFYPIRIALNGKSKTKLKTTLTTKGIEILQNKSINKSNKNNTASTFSPPNGTMISESDFIQLLSFYAGEGVISWVVMECLEPTIFDPETCVCDLPSEVEGSEDWEYAEFFIMVIYDDGWVDFLPWIFNFDPSSITLDPETPEEPIGGGGSGGGGGSVAEGDDPNLTPTASVTNVTPSATPYMLVNLEEGRWGLTWDESIDLEIGASLANGVWTAVLKKANGNYSVQSRLLPGVSEVGETSSSNFCTQIRDLKALGNITDVQWYMISAVQAHENVHVSRTLPSLNNVLSNISNDVKTLTVTSTGQTKAQAIAELRNLVGFQTITNNAKVRWRDEFRGTVPADHATGGPCELAERAIVDPTGIGICNTASAQAWPTCTFCPY